MFFCKLLYCLVIKFQSSLILPIFFPFFGQQEADAVAQLVLGADIARLPEGTYSTHTLQYENLGKSSLLLVFFPFVFHIFSSAQAIFVNNISNQKAGHVRTDRSHQIGSFFRVWSSLLHLSCKRQAYFGYFSLDSFSEL